MFRRPARPARWIPGTGTCLIAVALLAATAPTAGAAAPPSPIAAPRPAPPLGATPAPATPRTSTPAAAALPPARPVDAILADVIAALGGAAGLARHKSLHTKMEITFKGLGITGTAEHYAAVDDKSLTLTSIPDVASTREGSDGTHFWSEDPINGLRILDGAEAEQARIEAAWNAELRMKELFPKIEAVNEIGDNGARFECLVLTPRSGPPTTECFDIKTHLMSFQRGVRNGPQGDMPFTARLSDWRAVADLKMAYATEMQVGPLSFSGRVMSVDLDVPVDAALFAVPRGGGTKKASGRPPRGARGGKPAPPTPARP